MYCKLFIHSNSIKTMVSTLESEFGKTRNEINTYFFDQFDIHICKNKEADINKIHIYPDGFLFYEIIADIYSNHIEITDKILRIL